MKQNFLGIKWKYDITINEVEIYENYEHLKERLKSRYDYELSTWIYWNVIKNQIILNFLENNYWSKCSSKQPYQKMFTVHLTESNIWISGTIQNDLEDKVKRIYFSTFLPKEPKKFEGGLNVLIDF